MVNMCWKQGEKRVEMPRNGEPWEILEGELHRFGPLLKERDDAQRTLENCKLLVE